MSSALRSYVVVALLVGSTATRLGAADPLFAAPQTVSIPALTAAAPLVGSEVALSNFCPGAPRIAVPDPMVSYHEASNCPDCEVNWKKRKFPAGSWVYQTYGGYAFQSPDANFQVITTGFGQYWWDGWSLNLEFTGLVGNELRGNFGRGDGRVWGGAVDLLGRWHLWVYEHWSFYWDAGMGFSDLSISVPTGGTDYNFRIQVGAGWTIDLTEKTRLMLGGRWFHLSNGNFFTGRQNPGFDSLMLYAGVMWNY